MRIPISIPPQANSFFASALDRGNSSKRLYFPNSLVISPMHITANSQAVILFSLLSSMNGHSLISFYQVGDGNGKGTGFGIGNGATTVFLVIMNISFL